MKKINTTNTIILLSLVIIVMLIFIVSSRNNPTMTNESLFDKQERCAKNRENAQKQLKDSFKLATPYFYDIFYSSKTGTCIYTYGLILSGQSPNEIGSFAVTDYFTGEQLFSVDYDNSSGDENQYSYTKRPQFSDMVEEYKK